MADMPRVLRPRPLRAFNGASAGSAADHSPSPHPPQFLTEASISSPLTPTSPPPPPPPVTSTQDSSDLGGRTLESSTAQAANGTGSGASSSASSTAPSRSQSVLNLTSSALAGIFQPSLSSSASPKYSSSVLRDPRSITISGGARAQTILYENGESVDERIDERRSQTLFENKGRDGRVTANSASVAGKRYNNDLTGKKSLESAKKKDNNNKESSALQIKVHQHMTLADTFRVLARLGLLFLLGIAYGLMVSRLHDDGRVAPVQVQGVDRSNWLYLCLWGCAGILLGTMMPWVDALWSRRSSMKMHNQNTDNPWEKWYAVVRSVGAFVGVAFAIRKLPWQSTLQLSVTLALANPALWYLLDRSSSGILLSALISFIGTITLLHLNPEMLPMILSGSSKETPSYSARNHVQDQFQNHEQDKSNRDAGHQYHNGSFLLYEQIGVVTWIASVLFCSCVCLGNIGRRLVVES